MSKQISVRAGDSMESTVPHPSFPQNVFLSAPSGEGTITCFAKNEQGKPVLLTCSHVMFPGFSAVPRMRVFSPDYSSCCSSGDPIGTPVFDRNKPAAQGALGAWVNGYRNGKWYGGMNDRSGKVVRNGIPGDLAASSVDCAIAELDAKVHFRNVWPDGTVIKGVVPPGELGVVRGPKQFSDPIAPEQYVRIWSSRAKKVVYGTLLYFPDYEPPSYSGGDPDHIVWSTTISDESDEMAGNRPTIERLMILPRPDPGKPYNEFHKLGLQPGDSGSAVINHQNLIIGILTRVGPLVDRRHPERFESVPELQMIEGVAHATLIRPTLEHLKITIPNDPNGWEGIVPASGGRAQCVAVPGSPMEPQLEAQRRGIQRLRSGLLTTRRGRLILGKIAQHRSEVRKLISGIRAIAAAWRDFRGPAFFNHCMRSAAEPQHIVPTTINGVTRAELFAALLPLLARHGSPSLRRDIERYGAMAVDAALRMAKLDDLASCLATRWQVEE